MNSPILFIGYEPSLHGEIREFLKEHQGEAYFTSTAIETIRLLDAIPFEKAVLYMNRLEDAAILRYINMHYREIKVLVMPGAKLQDAIPALAAGNYEILNEPFRLEELGL